MSFQSSISDDSQVMVFNEEMVKTDIDSPQKVPYHNLSCQKTSAWSLGLLNVAWHFRCIKQNIEKVNGLVINYVTVQKDESNFFNSSLILMCSVIENNV